ncbi:hypothetical protein K435DRAFT_793689 [Dendrothele bispora CBS 962.96]|uniref:Uncharacterized protein n=1 Tax=Dendrothele bispora (strain CBS 962.96) TaxID=1314807 RepID=A0A4S8MEF3_DENBC|nr:hypothetical protein K435DRAFT_793689 [Dendrothele bispora CBS 962.96]
MFDDDEDQDRSDVKSEGVAPEIGKRRAVEKHNDNNGEEKFEENWEWIWFGRWVRLSGVNNSPSGNAGTKKSTRASGRRKKYTRGQAGQASGFRNQYWGRVHMSV